VPEGPFSVAQGGTNGVNTSFFDFTADGGHATPDEFDKFECAKMLSFGYVYKKNKNFVWTFASYDETDEVYSDRNVFPIGCIIKMEKINI
jgi:ethanolamine utilization protein EutQ (cupin superfamily)